MRAFKDAIRTADAVLIATPEYNGSLPGLVKNALDWASRPYMHGPLRGKPVAAMGASPGLGGTRGAQADLRRLLAKIGARVVPGPEVAVASAATMFAPDGTLVHAPTRDDLRALVAALAATARAEAAEAVA